MPAQEGIGLEDEEGFPPSPDPAGKEDEPKTVGWGEAWLADLAMEDDELLAEEDVLSDEFGSRARDIQRSGENKRMAARQGKVEESLFHGIDYGVGETD